MNALPLKRLHAAVSSFRDYFWLVTVGIVFVLVTATPSAGSGESGRVFVFEQGVDEYEGFEDTSIFSENENAGGGIDGLFSGTIRTSPFHRRALLRVDLSALPPGSVVESATLELVVERSGGFFGDFDIGLYRIREDWAAGAAMSPDTEGGAGAPASTGDATWISNLHEISLWENPGGDFVEEASAFAAAGVEGEIAVWSGDGLRDDVQRWLDDPSSNYGWVAISAIEGELQRVKRFYSSEAAGNRPRLTVVLSAGEGAGEPGGPVGCGGGD